MPSRWGRLADLFRVLEDSKALWDVRHYSVSQTPLEQVPRRARQAALGVFPCQCQKEPGHLGMPPSLIAITKRGRPVGGGFVCCVLAARGNALGHLVGSCDPPPDTLSLRDR